MSSLSLVTSALVLVAGFSLPGQERKWKPLFDYTNLPPTNEELWKPLLAAEVQLVRALEVARETEGAAVRPLRAQLEAGAEGAEWKLELFVGDGEKPKRVNLRVSAAEPKVLRRLELRTLAADEVELWKLMSEAGMSAENANDMAVKSSAGDKETPAVNDPRVRTLAFNIEDGKPVWDIELMGTDVKRELPRRYHILVDSNRPIAKQKILLDRFVGEPLRRDVPVELENGMLVFDFTAGDGQVVTPESKVKVNYRLFLLDSTKIHDTWKSRLPETFVVSEAPLKGMTEGMAGMRVGGKRKIAIPYPLAFGEAGNALAPPKAMVVCDISVDELVSESAEDAQRPR